MAAFRLQLVMLAGLVLIAGFVAAPDVLVFAKTLPMLALVAITWRASVTRGPGRIVWMLFAAAVALPQIGFLVGELTGQPVVYAEGPQPNLAWFVVGLSQVVLVAAIWRGAVLRGPRRDWVSTIDGAGIATAGLIPLYVLWIGPELSAADSAVSDVIRVLAFPLVNLVVVAVAVRAALGSGRRSVTTTLLSAGLALLVVTNVSAAVFHVAGEGPWTRVQAGWMVTHLLWAVAAVHPSAVNCFVPGDRRWGVASTKRIYVVVVTALVPLLTIAFAHIDGDPIPDLVVLGPLAAMAILLGIRSVVLARAGTRVWRAALPISLAGLMLVFVGFGLTRWQAESDRQRELATGLLQAAVDAEQLDAVTLRMLGAGQPVGSHALQSGRADMLSIRAAIDALQPNENGVRARDLAAYYDRYAGVLELGVRFISEGRRDKAAALVGSVAKPAHDGLTRELRSAAMAYRVGADASAREGRVVSVVVLLGSLGAFCLLLMRFANMRRDAFMQYENSRALEENERRIRALIDGAADIITVVDSEARIIAHGSTAERMLGYPAGSMHGADLSELLEPQQRRHLLWMLDQLGGQPGATDNLAGRLRCANGAMIDTEISIINRVDDKYLGGFVLNVRDVTERKQLEAKIEHQALHDPLTGLPNRGLLENRLRHLVRARGTKRVHAMLVLDVNDFKAVNDTFGHAIGDALLAEVAERLESVADESATVARIGGDEFAMLFSVDHGLDEVHRTAGLVQSVLREPVDLGGHWQVVRVSIGVALADSRAGADAGSDTQQAEHLLRNAELAMYEAKRRGNDDVEVFADQLHAAVAQRLALRNELEVAIADNQLALHYQPIIDLAGERVVGYEALVRWIHPERGMVSPGEFIPVAEESGLVVDLGRWVLEEACRQLAEWDAWCPDDRYVSVNVAGQQLVRESFIDEVISALHTSGLPARRLVLEMTETGVISDTEGNERRLDQLRELGVRLAVDDFGTGYSSLSYLHRFPFDLLKIDKAFIDRVASEEGRAIVEAMIRMADSLALSVVAEGIEEPEQAATLLEMNCAMAQGFMFSRPLPADAVPGFALPGDQAPRRVA